MRPYSTANVMSMGSNWLEAGGLSVPAGVTAEIWKGGSFVQLPCSVNWYAYAQLLMPSGLQVCPSERGCRVKLVLHVGRMLKREEGLSNFWLSVQYEAAGKDVTADGAARPGWVGASKIWL